MNTEQEADSDRSEQQRTGALREGLIARLRELDAVRSAEVEAAVRAVPRHLFVPEDSLEQAYEAERAPVTKRDEHGVVISSVSAARIQAFMLEQADIRPGMRVLEIGSGGYNAALIAELTGHSGVVVTLDIDADVTDRARRLLSAAGYDRVHVLTADGDKGAAEYAPFDRIIVTVEAADLPSAWLDQLSDQGRLVVPLRFRGLTRSVAFRRENGHLVSDGYELCGFVPMRGAGASAQDLVVLHEDGAAQVALRIDDRQMQADQTRLRAALAEPGVAAWSGTTIGRGSSYQGLDLWLATTVDRFAVLAATKAARDNGVVGTWSPVGLSALIHADEGSFAYLVLRQTDSDPDTFEFGAIGHGPAGEESAHELADQIRAWDHHRDHRAALTMWPTGTPDTRLPDGRVVDRPSGRLVITWPDR